MKSNKESLAVTHPNITKEWHPTKNGNLNPEDVTYGSGKKVWWICEKGHEWDAYIYNRTGLKNNCPYCSGRYPIVGETDLATTRPNLIKEWHPVKNGDLKPTDVTFGSDKKVWWLCEKGHEWELRVASRKGGESGCPYCSNNKVLAGFNDLATTHPELAKEWHPTKNDNKKPSDITYGSEKEVWWLCEKGHEWETTPNSRTNIHTQSGCPYCSNHKVLIGFNDLATTHPELIKEWHPTKNKDLKPTDVTFGSDKKVWWLCEKGHEWDAIVHSRARKINNCGCPECNIERRKSFQELTLFYYIKNVFKDAISGYKINGMEVDVYIPSIKLGIEYDGYYWHKDKIELDIEKTENLSKHIMLLRIREKGLSLLHNCANFYRDDMSNKGLIDSVIWVFNKIKSEFMLSDSAIKNIDLLEINIDKDLKNILSLISYMDKEDSILFKYPQLAKEWHPSKNGNLHPGAVTCGSQKKVYWICEKKHEWTVSVAQRVNGSDCPYCSGRYPIVGETDLATTHPHLAKEWHPVKNGDLKPTDVTFGREKKVWWICEKGHEWDARIGSRTYGTDCPYCSNRKLLSGYNDLATVYPELAKQWHPTKNGSLTPSDIIAGAAKRIWWICEKGHDWEVSPDSRIRKNNTISKCPYCINQKIWEGFNDLKTTSLDICEDWDYSLNKSINPTEISSGSTKVVWWKCKVCKDSYERKINLQVKAKSCPLCKAKIK